MRVVFFVHSLRSCWNHGNAHFLRGVVSELLRRGHDVRVHEPADAWSAQNLAAEHGERVLGAYQRAYPALRSELYDLATLDLEQAVGDADVVVVHEWNDPALVRRLGELRARSGGLRLLFHDTHHRAVTAPQDMARYDLRHYDGVLAFGRVIRDLYLERGWAERAWTWHEAADAHVFHPIPDQPIEGDVVWIGNWGDDERTQELEEYLLGPIRRLGLMAHIHGVRYPEDALRQLRLAGISYGGWLANFDAPTIYARHLATVHVPRRPYVEALPGIPTIRVFEALACGIPLVCAPWDDAEGLFTPGEDYLVARGGQEMERYLSDVIADPVLARALADHGRKTILDRHTCAHRVDELLGIVAELQPASATTGRTTSA